MSANLPLSPCQRHCYDELRRTFIEWIHGEAWTRLLMALNTDSGQDPKHPRKGSGVFIPGRFRQTLFFPTAPDHAVPVSTTSDQLSVRRNLRWLRGGTSPADTARSHRPEQFVSIDYCSSLANWRSSS